MITLTRALVALSLFASVASALAQTLKVGDPAPALTVDKWLKGEPVKELKKGEVYVVEFWASWCGPCKESIPHLTELKKKYGNKLNIIGVSIWETEPKDIEPFVKQMGKKMDYLVATDKVPGDDPSEGAMAKNWMEAAGMDGIPTAFIVDREGKIAWRGHPLYIDEPLEKVIDGTYKPGAEQALEEKQRVLGERYKEALEAGDWDNAMKTAEEAMQPEMQPLGYFMKMNIYIQTRDFKNAVALSDEVLKTKDFKILGATMKWDTLFVQMRDYDEAYKFGKEALAGPLKDDWTGLNQISWGIVDPDGNVDKKDLDLALKAAERSVKLDRNHFNVDTLARVWFLKGDMKKAISLQKEAVKLAPEEEKAELQRTLELYEKSGK
jgi:thiol-disulfide isomerase/thioredoxin